MTISQLKDILEILIRQTNGEAINFPVKVTNSNGTVENAEYPGNINFYEKDGYIRFGNL